METTHEHPATSTLKFCRSMANKYRELLKSGDASDTLKPQPRKPMGKPMENRDEIMGQCRDAFERGECARDIAAAHGVQPQTLIRYAWTHGWTAPMFESNRRTFSLIQVRRAIKYINAGAKPTLAAKQVGISYATLLDGRQRLAAISRMSPKEK